MGFNFFNRTKADLGLFNGHFIDVRFFYVSRFNTIPCVTFIGDVDITMVIQYLYEHEQKAVKNVYQHSYFEHTDKEVYFTTTIVELTSRRMIELADNFCHVLHTIDQTDWVKQFATDISRFKIQESTAYRHTHVVGFAKAEDMN